MLSWVWNLTYCVFSHQNNDGTLQKIFIFRRHLFQKKHWQTMSIIGTVTATQVEAFNIHLKLDNQNQRTSHLKSKYYITCHYITCYREVKTALWPQILICNCIRSPLHSIIVQSNINNAKENEGLSEQMF